MRELTIGKNDAGVRLDRFVSKALPLLPPALMQKYIRIKRIKVNGARAQRDQRLAQGDVVQLYINDEFFDKPSEENLFLTLFKPQVDTVYEDENLLLVNKRPGLVVHADETEKVNTLINHIQAYLYQKREWNPRWENAFAPALCNRIDRNTGGMVIAAKNAETLRIINEKIRLREIDKRAAEIDKVQDVLLEFNISGEESKTGLSPDDMKMAIDEAKSLSHVRVLGLMCMAPNYEDVEMTRPVFRKAHEMWEDMKKQFPEGQISILSMGMTHDFEQAIEEGATMVRIGTAIFGSRVYH